MLILLYLFTFPVTGIKTFYADHVRRHVKDIPQEGRLFCLSSLLTTSVGHSRMYPRCDKPRSIDIFVRSDLLDQFTTTSKFVEPSRMQGCNSSSSKQALHCTRTRDSNSPKMAFIPRVHFPFPTNTPSWFAGHMSRSLTKLPTVLKDIDLVIEARDSRLPLTSINPAFEQVLEESWGRMDLGGPSGWKGKGKEKVVVYTKRDQAEERFEEVSPRLPDR